jgi:OFA family oxalate/formate antiporter-like MFS transporter
VSQVFTALGILMLVLTVPAGYFLTNPPAGFVPTGYTPPASTGAAQAAADAVTAKQCILSSRFLLMWVMFFFNIIAGIMFIGFQSPLLQDLLKVKDPAMTAAALAAAGATLIGISSIFNGIGRFFWGGLSDKIGRVNAFRLILGSQCLVFLALLVVKNPIVFGVLVCYILLCYGGGFGTMPSFCLDVFGAKNMPTVYGTIITAWGTAGIVGPQIVAFVKDHYAAQAAQYSFITGASLLLLGLLITLALSNKRMEPKAARIDAVPAAD